MKSNSTILLFRLITVLGSCVLMNLAGSLYVQCEAADARDHSRTKEAKILYIVKDEAIHQIDSNLFGHFLERPSWGEIGVEGGLIPGTHRLQPGVLERLKKMHIPILRFPGGTDVDYMDWQDMIGHAPGRAIERPISTGNQGHQVTNNFGYDEFLRLCEELSSEAILVVNLADALLKRKPLVETARHAAALTAYCNAPAGAVLPEDMQDWPAIRARNGRIKPYRVKYFQIGNETWAFMDRIRKSGEKDPENFYVKCLEAYVSAIRKVDPSVRIIADAISPKIATLIHERLGDQVHYLVQHHYMPWRIDRAIQDGKEHPLAELSDRDLWYAWIAIPNTVNDLGESIIDGVALTQGRKHGFKVAVTEWNWNGGFWGTPVNERPMDSSFAKGIGAAGYLHAFMRSGDTIEIACQSMTVGNAWGITGIRADRQGQKPAYFLPSGQVTMFYSKHHGNQLLAMNSTDVPTFSQPFRMGGIRPKTTVAYLDTLATADRDAIYIHVINRHFSKPLEVQIDLSDFSGLSGNVLHHLFVGRLNDEPHGGEPQEIGHFEERNLTLENRRLRAVLPMRSISCLEIKRTPW